MKKSQSFVVARFAGVVHRSFSVALLLSVLAFWNACAPRVHTKTTPQSMPSGHGTPEPLQREAEYKKDAGALKPTLDPLTYDVKSYDLKGSFDAQTRIFSAEVVITLSLLEAQQTLVLNSGVSRILSVEDNTGRRTLSYRYTPEERRLEVSLPSDLRLATAEWSLRIKYEVDVSRDGALQYVPARKGDPVAVPVLYTSSEPVETAVWMPCQDRPDDRARFSIELTMNSEEALVANGLLVKDETTVNAQGQSVRTMAYRTEFDLPAYVMAFAQGDFAVAKKTLASGKEISVWSRRGLPVDATSILAATENQIATYEKLLRPYPWEKYAIVLLPEMGGGMENVSITFNDETSSSQGTYGGDWGLMAHELGHQWFGDFVTVHSWDDLWIKEGMATLLASESTRAFEDRSGSGRLLGDTFWFVKGEAIVDEALAPDEKYTSGPYDRAAWLLSQIRSAVGEQKFWASLRSVLAKYGLSSISTEEFLAEFSATKMAGGLTAEQVARVRSALKAKAVPTIKFVESHAAQRSVVLEDADSSLLMPLTLDTVTADKKIQNITSLGGLGGVAQAPLPAKTDIELLLVDARDVHPSLEAFFAALSDDDKKVNDKSYSEWILPLLMPSNSAQMDVFVRLPGYLQKLSLKEIALWTDSHIGNEGEFSYMLANGSAESNRALLTSIICSRAAKDDPSMLTPVTEHAGHRFDGGGLWGVLALQALQSSNYLGMDSWSPSFQGCENYASVVYATELNRSVIAPADPQRWDAKLQYLEKLNLNPEDVFDLWKIEMLSGHSVRARTLAAREYAASAEKVLLKDTPVIPALRERWLIPLRQALISSEISKFLNAPIATLTKLKDTGALPGFGQVVQSADSGSSTRAIALCGMYAVDAKYFSDFISTAEGRSNWPQVLKDIAADPLKKCTE